MKKVFLILIFLSLFGNRFLFSYQTAVKLETFNSFEAQNFNSMVWYHNYIIAITETGTVTVFNSDDKK